MLVIRYLKDKILVDQEVDFNKAHKVYKKIKRKYKYAEIILIDNGKEHHVW